MSQFYQAHVARSLDTAIVRSVYFLTTGLVGRGYITGLRCVGPLVKGREAGVTFADGSRFVFPLSDDYWSRLLVQSFTYEPEIAEILLALRSDRYTFFDLGANLGYWSVLASSAAFGGNKAVAVEASKETFAKLQRNADLNGGRFEIRYNAISDTSGVDLLMSTGHHTARHVTAEGTGEVVKSVSLDTLARDLKVTPQDRVVVKLDVEGAEILAIQGGSRLLAGETLLIYEDHGNDPKHVVSEHLMGIPGMQIGYANGAGKIVTIADRTVLTKLKTNAHKGYNFFATDTGSCFHRDIWI
jgi:FkbM family methyltransferase